MRAYGGLGGICQEKGRESKFGKAEKRCWEPRKQAWRECLERGLGGDRGQTALETVARAAGRTEWLRMSAQALRCAKTASAEAAPLCVLLWSSANAAGAKRDRKLQVPRARRVLKRALPG